MCARSAHGHTLQPVCQSRDTIALTYNWEMRHARPVRVCYAGTYERDYPRNRLVIDALRHAGARVEEAHTPVFERERDKSQPGAIALGGLALRLVQAYARLVPEVMLRLLRCDALMVGYIGQADALILGSIARAMGKPVIFNPLVTLTDTIVEDRGRFGERSLPARAFAAIDRAALRVASLILTDTEENARYLGERFDIERSKVAVVPVGAEEPVFYPGAPAPQASESGEIDVLFVGKFIPLHGIETILRAAAFLEERGVPARIELVGTGQTHIAMRALAEQLGLRSVVWTDWIPFERLGDRLRRADVALGVFDAGAKAGRVIPNKVYQSIACRVATITRRGPAVETLLRDGESALLVPPADPEALAAAITRLADPVTRRRIAEGGYQAFTHQGSIDAIARALRPALDLIERQRERR